MMKSCQCVSALVMLALLAFVAAASAGVAHAQTTEGPTPSLQARRW